MAFSSVSERAKVEEVGFRVPGRAASSELEEYLFKALSKEACSVDAALQRH